MTQAHNVLVAQDLSCFGQVSLSVALPLLGATGVTPTVLPTALLSTHTGGFGENTFCDLSGQFGAIFAHWRALGLRFNAAYLGYLGSQASQALLQLHYQDLLTDDCLLLVDPVLGDHGKLYRGFAAADVAALRTLVHDAGVITPNYTEAQLLLGLPLTTSPLAVSQAVQLAQRLATHFNVAHVVISDIPQPDGSIGICGVSRGIAPWTLTTPRLRGNFFGTGDIFASVIFTSLLHQKSLLGATKLAVKLIQTAIHHTPIDQDSRIGVNYAAGLPALLAQLTTAEEE